MFTLADTPVKFVALLVLFLWCTGWSVYELTRPQDRTQRVSNVLHLVMSLVMLIMVSPATWKPFAGLVSGPALIAVFVLATAWFVGLAVTRRATRGHYLGHAAMFGAMAWHLVGMVIKMPLMNAGMQTGSATGAGGMGGMQHGGAGMSGMGNGMHDMGGAGAGLTPLAEASQPGGSVWIVALVGIPFMVYLLAAAVRDLVAAVRPAPAGHGHATGHHVSPTPAARAGAGAVTDGTDHITTQTAHAIQTVEQTRASVATCHEVRPTGSAIFRLAALAGFAMNFGMFWMSTGLLTPIMPWMKILAF